MSVVVAIKDGDKIWMACDSQVSSGHTKSTLTNPNNYKIIRPEKEKETLIGVVGKLKLLNALKVQDDFIDELTKLKDELNFKYIFTKVIPNIFSIAKSYGIYKENDNMINYFEGSILFAHKDKLFDISGYGSCIEVDDYVTIGSGRDLARGCMNQYTDENKKDAIIKAVKASCKSDLYVNYPIIVMNTKDEETIVINE